MPGPEYRTNYYDALKSSNVYKSVNANYLTNVLAAVWTPASGKKFKLKGGCLKAVCTVICNGSEVAGNQLILCDSVVTVPIYCVGVVASDDIVAGSCWPGPQTTDAAPVPTTTLYWNDVQPVPFVLPEGYVSATADNVLKFGLSSGAAAVTVGTTGSIFLVGCVWGTEVL